MVIREYDPADWPNVKLLFHQNTTMFGEEQQSHAGVRLVAVQGETLAGFAALTPGMPGAYSLNMLVDPSQRRRGIGTALWRQMAPTLASDTWLVCCGCPAQNAAGHAFMPTIGFDAWFSDDLMHYSGPSLPDPKLAVRPYSDADRFDWIRLINEGFYPIRRDNDIAPYNVFRDDAADDPAVRQRLLDSANDKMLFYDGEQLVGLGALAGSEIDPITVVADQRGKGYGRRIMAHCTNEVLARGFSPVILRVVKSNVGARALYASMGYQSVEQEDMFRLKLSSVAAGGVR